MPNHSSLTEKRYVFADDDDKCSVKTRRGECDFHPVYECDKRLKREIANSNERRRMQSINTGFEDLRRLLPVASDGERLSKAAILQLTAKYIQTILLRLSTLEKEMARHHQSAPVTIPCENIRKRRLNSYQNGDIAANRNFSQPMKQEGDDSAPRSLASKKTPGYPPTTLRPPFHRPHNQTKILRPASPDSPNRSSTSIDHLPIQVYSPTFHHPTNQSVEPSLSANHKPQAYPPTNQKTESPHPSNQKSQSYPATNQKSGSPQSSNQKTESPHISNQKTESPHISNQKTESPHLSNQKTESPHISNQKTESHHLSNQKTESPHLSNQKTESSHLSNQKSQSYPATNQKSGSPQSSNQKTPGSLEHLVAAIEQVEGEQFYLRGLPQRGGRLQGDCAVMRPTISPFTEKIILAVSRHPHMFPRAPSHPAQCPSHPHGNQTP